MKLIIEPPAREELDDAVLWYEEQTAGLGEELADVVEAAMEIIRANPMAGGLLETCEDPHIRRVMTRRFPYVIIYDCLRLPTEVRVLAIMHTSRRPNYWEPRR